MALFTDADIVTLDDLLAVREFAGSGGFFARNQRRDKDQLVHQCGERQVDAVAAEYRGFGSAMAEPAIARSVDGRGDADATSLVVSLIAVAIFRRGVQRAAEHAISGQVDRVPAGGERCSGHGLHVGAWNRIQALAEAAAAARLRSERKRNGPGDVCSDRMG